MNDNPEKQQFLKEFGDDYGYPHAPKTIDEIRATEFKRLEGSVYLDHAGATLYSESQIEKIFKDLNSTVFGNPHSQSNCSLITSDSIDEARQKVLSFFNASPKEYKCIFTSGATAALKLVGETFPWSRRSSFMYTMENHNSVLGIREYALNKGAATFAVDVQEAANEDKSCRPESSIELLQHQIQRRTEAGLPEGETGDTFNLFAFPSECNFSGVKFNLDLVRIIKEDSERLLGSSQCHRGSWMVLIDAAKGCATDPPDLSKYKADFVVLSFYKIFGYPTGLGALLVRNDASRLMRKTYFSGGTVAASIADIDFVKRRDGVEEFLEDGTASFLSIISIHQGFNILNTLTMSSISRHTTSLATYVRKRLLALRHGNGCRVCQVYGLGSPEVIHQNLGPTISFNLKRPDGSWFGYHEVEKLASLAGIQLRTGCFCNPGACAKHLGLSHSDLLSNIEAGHVCWDDHDVLNGKPTGAVRVSFGYMSTFEDARKLMNFIEKNFLSLPSVSSHLRPQFIHPPQDVEATQTKILKSITIYPIKSCGGFSVKSWPLTGTGLLHDREWILKSMSGDIITQKKVPDMCYITTLIDLNLRILFVESPRCKDKLRIGIDSDLNINGKGEMDVYARRYEVQSYDNETDAGFSKAVGRPCTLLRSFGSQGHASSWKKRSPGMCRDWNTRLSFVNEAQLLLISEESISDLNNRIRSIDTKKGFNGPPVQVNSMRFRPNLVLSGGRPYEEDEWRSVTIGNKYFKSLGGCNRCQVININAEAGEVQRSNEPLATLASYRRVKGKILFGILLQLENMRNGEEEEEEEEESDLQVGQEIFVEYS